MDFYPLGTMDKMQVKIIRIIGSVMYWLMLIFLVLLILTVTFSKVEAPLGYRVYVVQSGSMEPAIATASLVITRPQVEYAVGDVITYLDNINGKISTNGSTIMHRITSVVEVDDKTVYRTKGDANPGDDPDPVTAKQVLGKMVYAIPYLGKIISFAKTQLGLIILIVIPSTVIVYDEFLKIKAELQKIISKRKRTKLKKPNSKKTSTKSIRKPTKKITTALIIMMLLSNHIKPVSSMFSDTEVSENNTITTGIWDEPKMCLVINEVYYDVKDDGMEGTENKNEWIELYNDCDEDINPKNWYLVDGQGNTKIIHPNSKTIPAKGFLTLSHDATTWVKYWMLPAGVDYVNLTGGRAWLNNDGDSLMLYDPYDNEIDFVAWKGFETGWDLDASDGRSIAREEKGVDTDMPGDWEVLNDPNPGINPHSRPTLEMKILDEVVIYSIFHVSKYQHYYYELTYLTGERMEGVMGQKPVGGDTVTEEILLGTCSSNGVCIYHEDVHDLELVITLFDGVGGSIVLEAIN